MKKKGEMTTQQIVILIILIASFAVILFFLARLQLGKNNNAEICHNSVISRASVGKISSTASDALPLNCKRQYVCLSADGSCENMTSPDVQKVKTQDDVYKSLAEDMANCWWMFGEGKINYVGADMTKKLYCSQCSQIGFDNSVQKVFGGNSEFDKKGLYVYMTNHNYTDGQTYAEYLYGTNNLTKLYENNLGKVNLNSQYYSLMAITSDVSTLGWIGAGAALGVVGFATGGLGFTVGAIVVGTTVGGTGGAVLAPIVDGLSGNQYIPPSLIQVGDEYNSLNCDDVSTLS
jgi:hypothetical protein